MFTNWDIEGLDAKFEDFSEQNAIDCVDFFIEIMIRAQAVSSQLPTGRWRHSYRGHPKGWIPICLPPRVDPSRSQYRDSGGAAMNEKHRLYPTVKEDRELERLKQEFGLSDTAIAKSGGMPPKAPDKEAARGAEPDSK